MAAAGSLSDGSERDLGAQDSSNDADSEASESEWTPRSSNQSHRHMSTPSSTSTLTPSPTPVSASSPSSSSSTRQGGAVEQLVSAVSKVNLSFSSGDCSPSAHCSPEEHGETQSRDNLHHQHHQGAFQALSHSYTPSSKECSIQSCLHQFTSVELLMGNNRLLCESCTERRMKQLRKSSSAGKRKQTSGSRVQCFEDEVPAFSLQAYFKFPDYCTLSVRYMQNLPSEYSSHSLQLVVWSWYFCRCGGGERIKTYTENCLSNPVAVHFFVVRVITYTELKSQALDLRTHSHELLHVFTYQTAALKRPLKFEQTSRNPYCPYWVADIILACFCVCLNYSSS